MAIYQVAKPFIADIWPVIEGMAGEAMDHHPFMEAGDLRVLLDHDLLSLFIATDKGSVVGFGCLEVVQYPSRRVANILAAGGRRGFLDSAIKDLLPAMTEFGRSQGASIVALSGRPGWLRALRHLNGSSKRYVTWWADIDEQGRRKHPEADDHAGTVEAGSTLSN